MITVALAKGRLANESAELFEKCGIDASVVFSDTRKLVLESADKKFSFFLVKPSDVPTYVEYGIADMGIVGKDTLLEHEKDLYEMLDLKFEPCKLCVAGYPEKKELLTNPHLRVATKYVHTARKLYGARRGRGDYSSERFDRAGARHGAFGRDFRRGADGLDASGERAGGLGGSIRRFRAAGGE